MSTAQGDTRRVRTAIVLATLAGTSFFFAAGTSQLVASAFLDVPVEADGGVPVSATSAEPRRRAGRAGEPILERNIFDSTTGSIPWEDPPPPPPDPVTDTQPTIDPGDLTVEHPACEGSIRLVGAYVRRGEPDQSFAAVINATGTSLLYREGMQIDDRLVMMIERHRVVLRTASSSLCDLNMFGTATGTPVASAPAMPAPVVVAEAPAAGPETGGVEAADLDANIHQVSDTNYTINRGLVDRLLANQAALMSAARVIPHEEDGRTVGMKIYGIRRSSLLGRLGVQNGDMLRTINGFDLTDPNAILQAYTQLRAADHLTLQIVRRGNPVSMDYQIQ